jgi:TolB-like protein
MPILAELRRRHVFRVAVLYLAVAWLVLQATDVVGSLLQLPHWVGKLVVFVLAIGLPITLVSSWLYELTPEGIKRDSEVTPDPVHRQETTRRLNVLTVAAAVLAIAVIVGDRLIPERPASGAASEGVVDASPAGDAAGQPAAGTAGARQTIAVLPFVNMSADPAQEFFSDGVSEEILNLLANVEGLRVTSRTSSFSFKGQPLDLPTIARKLGVTHIVEGSVRRSGESVRVTAQLIDVDADAHLWSDTYERTVDDVFAIQADVAGQIAKVLKIAMGAEEVSAIGARPTANLEAWQEFLQARYRLRNRTSVEDLRETLRLVDRAIARDPDFARAHSLRAAVLVLIANWTLTTTRPDADALAAADRALALNPRLGEPYLVRALISQEAGNWLETERNFGEAIARAPNDPDGRHWYGSFLLTAGYLDQAWAQAQRAAELDPLSPMIAWNVAFAALTTGRYDAVDAFARKSRENGWPSWEPVALQGGKAMQHRDVDAAERHYMQAFPQKKEVLLASFDAIRRRHIDQRARRLLDELSPYGPPGLARWPVEVAADDLDAAYATVYSTLDRASLVRPDGTGGPPRPAPGSNARVLRGDWWFPMAIRFRQDPRFADLLRSVGLVEFWRAKGWPDMCRPQATDVECN